MLGLLLFQKYYFLFILMNKEYVNTLIIFVLILEIVLEYKVSLN